MTIHEIDTNQPIGEDQLQNEDSIQVQPNGMPGYLRILALIVVFTASISAGPAIAWLVARWYGNVIVGQPIGILDFPAHAPWGLGVLLLCLQSGMLVAWPIATELGCWLPSWERVSQRGSAIRLVVILWCAIWGVSVGWGLLSGLLGIEPPQEQDILLGLLDLPIAHQIWTAIVIVFAPALAEELLFRRIIFRVLEEQYGLGLGLTVSSLAFALVHWNPTGFLLYFAIGACAGYAYYRTGQFWTAVSIHALNNALAVGLLLAGVQG